MRAQLLSLRGLYAIVDPAACRGRDPVSVAEAIVRGGCAMLQLRAKRLHRPALESLAAKLRELCTGAAVPFVVNDHVELAVRVGADGVHLGQDDMPVASARSQLGPEIALGVSTHDLAQARAAEVAGADLIGFGPVFPTASKENPDAAVGLSGLRAVCSAVALPVVAIGGIAADNAAAVAACGPAMAAAISALCSADDPTAAARQLHRALSTPAPGAGPERG